MNPILIAKSNCPHAKLSPFRYFMIIAGASALLMAGLSSCATTRGFGQDVERTGDKIQEAASN